MIFQIIQSVIVFLEANIGLLGLVFAVVEYVKLVTKPFSWYKSWYITIFAFVVSFVFAIPAEGFIAIDWVMYIAQSIGVGLVTTGVYKMGTSIVRKASTL